MFDGSYLSINLHVQNKCSFCFIYDFDVKRNEIIVDGPASIDDDMELTIPMRENLNAIITSDFAAEQTEDDTEKLINLEPLNSEKISDFSKVIAGDLVASFSSLPTMRLRGINSTSFVQDFISGAKTPTSENDRSVEDMDISVPGDNGVESEIIVTKPIRDNDINVEYTNAASKISFTNVTDEKIKDEEPSNIDLDKSDDITPEKENSIVELCTKITAENTSLLCDTSAVSNLTDFSVEEISNGPNSNNIHVDDTEYVFGVDNLPSFDTSRMEEIMKKSREVVGVVRRYEEKMRKEMEEQDALARECIDAIERKRKLLEEFEALTVKAGEILNSEYTEESLSTEESRDGAESLSLKGKILKLSEG